MTADPSFITSVRKRPGLYIGPADQRAALSSIRAACQVALATAPPQRCAHILLSIAADQSFSLHADGPYAEGDLDPATLVALATAPPTIPWSDTINIGILNALAQRFDLEFYSSGRRRSQSFSQGRPLPPAVETSTGEQDGLRITFAPDRTILSAWDGFSIYPISGYLRTAAALQAGLRATLRDERDGTAMEICYCAGLRSYLSELTYPQASTFALAPPLTCYKQRGDMAVDAVIQWHGTIIQSYVNGYLTAGGGSHVAGLRQGLARTLDRFARQRQIFSDDIPHLRTRDLPPALAALIHVRADNPRYAGALAEQLSDQQIQRFVCDALIEQLPAQLAANPEEAISWASQHAARRTGG